MIHSPAAEAWELLLPHSFLPETQPFRESELHQSIPFSQSPRTSACLEAEKVAHPLEEYSGLMESHRAGAAPVLGRARCEEAAHFPTAALGSHHQDAWMLWCQMPLDSSMLGLDSITYMFLAA